MYAVFFYIIFAVLIHYHDVNNGVITSLKIVSDIKASAPCGVSANVIWVTTQGSCDEYVCQTEMFAIIKYLVIMPRIFGRVARQPAFKQFVP